MKESCGAPDIIREQALDPEHAAPRVIFGLDYGQHVHSIDFDADACGKWLESEHGLSPDDVTNTTVLLHPRYITVGGNRYGQFFYKQQLVEVVGLQQTRETTDHEVQHLVDRLFDHPSVHADRHNTPGNITYLVALCTLLSVPISTAADLIMNHRLSPETVVRSIRMAGFGTAALVAAGAVEYWHTPGEVRARAAARRHTHPDFLSYGAKPLSIRLAHMAVASLLGRERVIKPFIKSLPTRNQIQKT